ncbi:MAG: hypothetical protein ACK51X_01350, partial [Planctomycetota bacterium]
IQRKELPDGRVFEGRFDPVTGAPLAGTKLTDGDDTYVGEYDAQWRRPGRGRRRRALRAGGRRRCGR